MTRLRFEKIARIANDIPDLEVFGDEEGGDLLVLGWGSTLRRQPHRGAARSRRRQERLAGRTCATSTPSPRTWATC